jgi:phenylpropionate dioxygenase-like ring-hydroxylating dioxygenase large terminal subunit
MSDYLQNAWYVAAWSEEIPAAEPFARTILDRKIAFYRKADTTLVAVGDRCPHRFANLSAGTVVDDCIVCPYHALKYNEWGACVESPSTGHIPRGAQLVVFPVIERYSLVWVWLGPSELASAASIPDFEFLTDPARQVMRGHLVAHSNYELCMDNLMDLSHVPFVHSRSIARPWQLEHKRAYSAWTKDGAIHSLISYPEMGPLPDDPPGTEVYDFFIDMGWYAPSCMILNTGRKPVDAPLPRYGEPAAHIVTPETRQSTHYFWSATTTTGYESPETERLRREGLTQAFLAEDKPLLESIQKNMIHEDFWDEDPIVLPSDAGAIQVRRALQKRVAAEAGL